MATKLELANRAIYELGGTPIDDLDSTVNKTAKVLKPATDACIHSVLFEHDWPTNRKTAQSTGVSSGLLANLYTFSHDLSALDPELKMLRRVLDSDGFRTHDYRVEGTSLYADYETLYLQYSYDITDPAKFPPYLIDAIVARITYEVSIPVTGSENRKNIALQEYESVLSSARLRASQECPHRYYLEDDEFQFLASHGNY